MMFKYFSLLAISTNTCDLVCLLVITAFFSGIPLAILECIPVLLMVTLTVTDEFLVP